MWLNPGAFQVWSEIQTMEIQLVGIINWWLISLKTPVVSTRQGFVPIYLRKGSADLMVAQSLCCMWVSQALLVGDEHQWDAVGKAAQRSQPCRICRGKKDQALLAPQKPFLGRR